MIINKDALIDAPERRGIPTSQFDVRSEGNSLRFEGYASTFDSPYDIYGGPPMGWHEIVTREAFKKTLTEKPDLHLLINHEGMPLARTKSGTMKLSADNHGLLVHADLDRRDPMVQSLQVKMERGDMDQMSFAFRVKKQTWSDDETHRYLDEVSLHKGDVSVVNFGANPTTNATIRSAIEFLANGPVQLDADQMAEIRSMPNMIERAEAILHSLRNLGSIDPDTPAIIVPDVVGTRAWDTELARQLANRDLYVPSPRQFPNTGNDTIYPGIGHPGAEAQPAAVQARADAPPIVPRPAPPMPGRPQNHQPVYDPMPQPYMYDQRQPFMPMYPYFDPRMMPPPAPEAKEPAPAPAEAREEAADREPVEVRATATGPMGPNGIPNLSAAQKTGRRKLTVAQLRAICDGELDL